MPANMLLISGGPGTFAEGDPEHDTSWANYVTPPLLLTDSAAKAKEFEHGDDVFWFVYRPAYEVRWSDDKLHKRSSVAEAQGKGFKSYVDNIETRARERKWKLAWVNDADELWTKLRSFNDPIRQVIYWGHASGDLWLTITQTGTRATAPSSDAIVRIDKIGDYANSKGRDGRLMRLRFPILEDRTHDWLGCNTVEFSAEWAEQVRVHSRGVEGKIDFKATHQAGNMPSLVGSAKIHTHRYSAGSVATTTGTSW